VHLYAQNPKAAYKPPQNISPSEGQVFRPQTAESIVFKWTPVSPKPLKPVIYKLRIWAYRKGESAAQVIRTNEPLISKETNEYQVTINKFLTAACKPPYQCNFVWNVQAVSKPPGNEPVINLGTSDFSVFSISGSDCSHTATISSISCLGLVKGMQQYKICVDYKNIAALGCSNCTILLTHPNNYPGIGGGGITVVSADPGTIINTILPAVPVNLTAGQQTTICFNASAVPGSSIKFSIHATCSDAMLSLPETERNHENSLFDTIPPSCNCKTCDSIQIQLSTFVGNQQNNNVTIDQDISVSALPSGSGLPIKSISAEVIYFDIQKKDSLCYLCEKNSDHLGKFVNASLNAPAFTTKSSILSNEIVFSANSGGYLNNNTLHLEITSPSLNRCCTDTINVCIRYTIITSNCKTCSVIKCYSLPRVK
jgi:hypothetical protein